MSPQPGRHKVNNPFVRTFFLTILLISSVAQAQESSRRIETHYGISYDLTPMSDVFDPSLLIIEISKIKTLLGVNIEGVVVLDQSRGEGFVDIIRTATHTQGNLEESSKDVLRISIDVAKAPERIIPMLTGEDKKTFAEKKREEIQDKRQESVRNFFGEKEISDQEKNKLSAKIAATSGKLIKDLDSVMRPATPQVIPIKISDYYLSFSEIFKTQPLPMMVDDSKQAPEEYKEETVQDNAPEEKIKYFSSGAIKQRAYYREGQLDGVMTFYYESGVIESEWPYTDGKLEGIVKLYYKNGKVKAEGRYLDGNVFDKKIYPENKPVVKKAPLTS